MPRKYRLEALTMRQLSRLRNDIVLCSIYIKDYHNRYAIDKNKVCDFFEGYADYLGELMDKDGIKGEDFFVNLKNYDNIANLVAWHDIYCGGI